MIFRIALAWLALSTAALAQTPSTVRLCNGTQPNCPLVGATNGLPVNVVGGTTGGGPVTIADGADVAEGAVADAAATAGSAGTVSAKLRFLTSVAYATSTNQTSQITQETAINTILGLQADAACSTDNGTCTIAALQKRGNQRLTTINTTLGSPFQAGGSIGNTTFGATQGTSPWVVGGNGTAGTAASGVLSVQGIASMTPVQVSQATAASLNATVVGTGTFATQATLATETTKVIGTVRAVGNVGGAFDAATGAAPPANAVQMGTVQSGQTGGFLKAPIVCDNYVYKHVTSATDTLAVQGVASQTVYVCGYEAFFAGTATFFLENTASANANCSSSNTQIAILVSGTAQSGIVSRAPFWNGLKNTSGNGLCINSTGTGGFDIGIYYAQF